MPTNPLTPQLLLEQSYEVVPVSELLTHPRNARRGDIGAIYQSIDTNGFYGAVVVQRSSNHVLAGNHRLIAARQAGISEIPVIFVDVDDDRALRILLADNKTSDDANYDPNMLAALLVELNGTSAGLGGTGYDGDELDELLKDCGQLPGVEPRDAGEANQLVPSGTCPHCGKAISIK